jgi:hypothetical protein
MEDILTVEYRYSDEPPAWREGWFVLRYLRKTTRLVAGPFDSSDKATTVLDEIFGRAKNDSRTS